MRPTYAGSVPAAMSGVGTSTTATPGAVDRISIARSGGRSRANSALSDSECPVNTGTRTHVPDTAQVGDAEDLAALVAELLLLVGLAAAVVDEAAGQRQHVEGDGGGELVGGGELEGPAVVGELGGAVGHLPDLLVELGDPDRPAPDVAW